MDVRRFIFAPLALALLAGCHPQLVRPDESRTKPTISSQSTNPSTPATSNRFAGASAALQISSPPSLPTIPTLPPATPTPAPSPVIPAANTVPAPLPEIPELPSIPTTPAAAPKPLAPDVQSQALPPPGDAKTLRELQVNAAKTFAKMDTYIMRLHRREVVAGSSRPEELILCKIRNAPFSVYMKWLGGPGKGREVTFVKDMYEGKIHSLTAPGDIPIFSGTVFSVLPDSPLVRSKSRYSITEAGIGHVLQSFDRLVTAAEKGNNADNKIEYVGPSKRPEFAEPVHHAKQTFAAKVDPNIPGGGVRHWYFDAASSLPVLLVAYDEKGQEVEYYCHDRFQYPVVLDNDDFNPDKLFAKKKN